MLVDSIGNVYVIGLSAWSYSQKIGTWAYDWVTVKYDKNGAQQWARRFHAAKVDDGAYRDQYDNSPNAVALDNAGNLIVVGSTYGGDLKTGGTGQDVAIIKYDVNGKILWGKQINGPARGDDWASSVAVDGADNLYVTGTSWGGDKSQGGTGYDILTFKFDTKGHTQWGRRYNDAFNGDDIASQVAVDSAGNVTVVGGGNGTYGFGTVDAVTLRYDTLGKLKWTQLQDGSLHAGSARTVVLDRSGNAYVGGIQQADTFPGTDGFGNETLLMKYDRKGKLLWLQTQHQATDYYNEDIKGIALDSSSKVYLLDQSYNYPHAPEYDILLIKYAP